MKQYVGITGFVSRAEVDHALSVLPEGLTLMCGVLVSEKTLRGERNRWWKRYAWSTDIADIFSPDPRCLNLIHYCSDVPPERLTIAQLQDFGGPRCHGFQFNGAWPDVDTLALIAEAWPGSYNGQKRAPGADVVLQVRPTGDIGPLDRLSDAIKAMRSRAVDCRVRALIDFSGGRGLPIPPDVCDAWGMTISGCFGTAIGLGFAGGLDAESLHRIAEEVRTWSASIDAEGCLRDGDEGGSLNFEKVRAYLAAAGKVMGPTGDRQS